MTRHVSPRGRRRPGSTESTAPSRRRCAIYTRVSTDNGLEQDFNSLDAQREACGAYIRSQAHEGWSLAPGHFDDGGYSGGTLDRPALTKLMEAVERRQIDVIVVYKVDRLTRSLADFAKLVETFDARGVSFISITQSFNTTTSMGRLTLNMLLSFAQFEREVTGERIRDKIAASKKKGIWVGGVAPFGYRVVERKLIVDEEEAETIRSIFDRYLALGSIGELQSELHQRGIVTRRRALATGNTIGGVPFTKGPLAYLLRNRMYLGELNHGANSYPAEHTAIVPTATFDAVQEALTKQAASAGYRQSKSDALLKGKLFDERGHPMTPSFAVKRGVRYRYYISRARMEKATGPRSASRVPAGDVEQTVIAALSDAGLSKGDSEKAVRNLFERVDIKSGAIEISLAPEAATVAGVSTISTSWTKAPFRVHREILAPAGDPREDPRAMTFDTRARLLTAIGTARRWVDDLVSGRAIDIESLAAREHRSARSISMWLSLAFLAPDLVKAIVENRMPRGIGLTDVTNLPSEWPLQRRALGLRH
jgi:DNA invertase Pin-like site-specific DNA recombinase